MDNLKYKVLQRRSDRDYNAVIEVGKASTEQIAYDILKSYAARCTNVSWISGSTIKFTGCEVTETGEVRNVTAWIEKDKEDT